MENKFFEIIKYKNYDINCGDFNGPESNLSLDEQDAYLRVLKNELLKEKNFILNKPIVSDREVAAAKRKIHKENNRFRNRQYLRKGNVSLIDLNEFAFLSMYTNKAFVCNNEIFLLDNHQMPQASFDYFGPEIASLELEIKIDPSFYTSLRGVLEPTVMGKYLEFRNNIKELFRIQFMSDGKACIGTLKKDIYHHSFDVVAVVDFKKSIVLNLLKITNGYQIIINGHSAIAICNETFNYFIASGGMFPTKEWRIKINKIANINNVPFNVFQKKNVYLSDIHLGNRKYPISIGGYKYRNRSIQIESSFFVNTDKEIYLHLSTLDPSGLIYINNQQVISIDTFLSQDINVSKYVQKGKNNIMIIINPRAPENLVSWHRNLDPYFASFVGEIYIEERASKYIKNVVLKCVEAKPTRIAFSSEVIGKYQGCHLDFIIKDKKEMFVNSYQLTSSKINAFENIDVALWNYKNPKLYDVILRLKNDNLVIDEYCFKFGFRTITQNQGEFLFNEAKFMMKGALLMQYLPPIDEVCNNHVCPSDEQIIRQILIAKKMNANTIRMHVLGYGNNEVRYARICDYLGINVIWTTRYIDSVSTCLWNTKWEQNEYYLSQIKDVINYCSIIAYEGANEMSVNKDDISNIYSEFVNSIKKVDDSRLLFPISHPYYANDSYNRGQGCGYYQDDGLRDEFMSLCKPAAKEWNDPLVVRSAHTYNWLLGYGTGWDKLRKQNWSAQDDLLKSHRHAYVVSEYAVIGRVNPIAKKRNEYINLKSYELGDESALNYKFEEDYLLSQTYQALAAKYTSKKMLSKGSDGLLWCSLISGANHGSYLKPIVDFNYYPKLAFYALKNIFNNLFIGDDSTDVLWGTNHLFKPTLFGECDYRKHQIKIEIRDINNQSVFEKEYFDVLFNQRNQLIDEIKLPFKKDGFYKIIYIMR